MCKRSSFSSSNCPDDAQSHDDVQASLLDTLFGIWTDVFDHACRLFADNCVEAHKYHRNALDAILNMFQSFAPTGTSIDCKMIEKLVLTNTIKTIERYLSDQISQLGELVSPDMIMHNVAEIAPSVHDRSWPVGADPRERQELIDTLTERGTQLYQGGLITQARLLACIREEVEDHLLAYRSKLTKVEDDLAVIRSVDRAKEDECDRELQLTSEIDKVEGSEHENIQLSRDAIKRARRDATRSSEELFD
jgi:hypothetical protein